MEMKNARIREAGDGKRYLEGYFAVFDQPYKVFDGWVESIAPGAFARYLASGADTKVLWNHDTNIVLGSTANKTAVLREDETGLFGTVEINEQDSDARNVYARIERGDVNGCSFGFDVARQEEWWDDDGVWHTRLTEIDPLYEVSPCAFPAYTTTSVSARAKETLESAREKLRQAEHDRLAAWKETARKKLRGETPC